MKTRNILSLLILLIPIMGFAQNDLQGKTVELSISEQTDISSGKTIQQSSMVQITDSEIVWGASIEDGFPMKVKSVSGTWDESSNMGEIEYDLQLDDGFGTASIEGNSGGITVILELKFSNGSAHFKLKVDNITYN